MNFFLALIGLIAFFVTFLILIVMLGIFIGTYEDDEWLP